MATQPDVMFWVHWRTEVELISLTKANNYRFDESYSEPTDEGYTGASLDLTMEEHSDGWYVMSEYVTGGRDCDGVISHTYVKHCHVDKLNTGNGVPLFWDDDIQHWCFSDKLFLPEWSDSDCRVYDQEAQRANY